MGGAHWICEQSNAFCVNTEGSFACVCQDGSEGELVGPHPADIVCEGQGEDTCESLGITCDEGFECLSPTVGCVDVDECAIADLNECRAFEQCLNEPGGYNCVMDVASCETIPVLWKGARFGRVFYRSADGVELRVTISNRDGVDTRSKEYYAFLTFGRKKCGGDFLVALSDGTIQIDVMDMAAVYTVEDVYFRDDAAGSNSQVMIKMGDVAPEDLPWSKKKGEITTKDQFYAYFGNLDSVAFGNKDWEDCLESVTVGVIQADTMTLSPDHMNACASWQKTIWG